ncbi:aspartic-type endopeptidase, putative [Metarhizium acridum CQMa 102]|uniref:Aspartic-type endopeptidase, putative n=1 Tax=Metarhizium acridum (strain CQMa 102) TaxID=655827 RepID=E9DW51_METAQ|nr:aspartic-type endopeptidase, putative [Metarhizium acridum CQMa 102]EFY92248.1 aspartic-type endopeptidase, putative [Metarhizium acridum CQMa 102]
MMLIRFFLHIAGARLAVTAPDSPVQPPSAPEWDLSKPLNGFTFQRAKAMSAAPTIDRPALLYSKITNIKSSSSNYNAVSSLVQILQTPPSHGQHTYQNISTTGNLSTQYAIQCGWDGAPVWLLLDTGSADTWAVQNGFECHDSDGTKHNQAACAFGNPHVREFQNGPIDGLHFYLKYGSGEKVFGPMGYADISCGGVSVPRQQAGLANYTYWHGNNLTVGILGLAYPSITSAFYGEIGKEAAWNAIQYVPFLTNAIMQGSIDPVFSVALAKNSSNGIIAWGGLPRVQTATDVYAKADLIIVSGASPEVCRPRLLVKTQDNLIQRC